VVVVAVAAIVIPMLTNTSTSTSYTTATVEKGTLNVTVSGSGNGVVSDVTEVQPSITGKVKSLSVKLGDTVAAGQVLFKIVNPDLDAAVAKANTGYIQAKQSLLQAKSSLTDAKRALAVAKNPNPPAVYDAAAVHSADSKVDSAKLGVTIATKNVASAKTALGQAEDDAASRTVTAPVSGVITVLNAVNGQSLSGNSSSGSGSSAASAGSTSNSAVEISDLSTLMARVSINEVDLVDVKVGMLAAVTFDALPDLITSGTISAIAPTGSSSSGGAVTYNVDITLVSPDARLKPTMSCTAEIITATRPDTLSVPTSAVRTNTSSQKKYVLVGDTSTGAITTVDVTTGVAVGTKTEILTGLKVGQTVLIGGTTSSSSSSGGSDRGGPGGGMGGMGAFIGRG
jgi:HlyD family secretion protein